MTDPGERPRIVAIIGSTRFFSHFGRVAREETLAGRIVLRPHVVKSSAFPGAPVTETERVMLDQLRRAEIDMADEVLVVNPRGYIGGSTADHIMHAKERGTPVRYLIPLSEDPEG